MRPSRLPKSPRATPTAASPLNPSSPPSNSGCTHQTKGHFVIAERPFSFPKPFSKWPTMHRWLIAISLRASLHQRHANCLRLRVVAGPRARRQSRLVHPHFNPVIFVGMSRAWWIECQHIVRIRVRDTAMDQACQIIVAGQGLPSRLGGKNLQKQIAIVGMLRPIHALQILLIEELAPPRACRINAVERDARRAQLG